MALSKFPDVDDLVRSPREQVFPVRAESQRPQRRSMSQAVDHQFRLDEVLSPRLGLDRISSRKRADEQGGRNEPPSTSHDA